jgi:hypothetical protein
MIAPSASLDATTPSTEEDHVGKFADLQDEQAVRRAKDSVVREQKYLEKVANAIIFDLPRISPWLTATCPECREDIDVMSPDGLGSHTIAAGAVIVGCEDYWVIDPKVLFSEDGGDGRLNEVVSTWGDWRYDPGGPLKHLPLPGPETLTDAQQGFTEKDQVPAGAGLQGVPDDLLPPSLRPDRVQEQAISYEALSKEPREFA